jgi:hypothetical protein
MKKLLLAAVWVWIAHSQANGQVSPLFQNLNFSECTSGLFWSQTNYHGLPPDGSAYAQLNSGQTKAALHSLRKAAIHPTTMSLPDYGQLRDEMDAILQDESIIPIVIIDLDFHTLDEQAITNEWVFATPEGLFQSPNIGNIFDSHHMVVMHIDMENYPSSAARFRLLEDHFFSSSDEPVQIQIDFDDGMGWRTINFGQVITVNYSNQTGEKHIKLNLIRGGNILKSGLKSESIPCVSNYDDPDPNVPWTTTGNPEKPWEISTLYNGTEVFGNAYYLPSGEFDKPFIFVEGIDFKRTQTATRNGGFGWCEFTSGMNHPDYEYSMLQRMPDLLDAVRARGYDIILLDFKDGATWIQHNAQLLIHLLQMVNSTKTGDYQNVVSGASMGGQITRYALAKMEQQNIDHCTRLWVSLDSPHTGAYIPISLQMALDAMQDDNYGAMDFMRHYIMRPASRQLLNIQLPQNNDWSTFSAPIARTLWYNELDNLGYPKQCKNITIANGNLSGSAIAGLNEQLINYSCELHPLLQGPELEMILEPSNAEPFPLIPEYYSYGKVTYTINENMSGIVGDIGGIVGANLTKNTILLLSPVTIPNYDFAPGGTRTSMQTFVDETNPTLEEEGCGLIQESDYIKTHSFIPTSSALGIQNVSPFANLNELLTENPELCPFDAFHAPVTLNEPHSYISEEGLEFVLYHVLALDNPDGSDLIPEVFNPSTTPASSFNFGTPALCQFPSTTIELGGSICINKYQPINYGLQNENFPDPVFLLVETLGECDNTIIKVRNFGILEIGDPSSIRTGELRITRNASLRLEAGGLAIINPGSKLVIEEGGLLVVEAGAILDNRGDIIVQPGGRILYKGGNWKLNGTAARLVLDGGELHIDPGVTLAFTHDGSFGHVEFTGAADHDLFLGQGSVIRITGTNSNDLILVARDWANAWNGNFGLGHLVLENGAVDLSNNGQLWLDMKLTATNCIFQDLSPMAGNSTIQPWYTTATLKDCTLDKVLFKANSSRCYITNCTFGDALTGADMTGGFYRVRNSDFTDCGVRSSALQNPSVIDECSFTASENANPLDIAIEDESLTRITVSKTLIDYANTGISKQGGSLVLACNTIVNSNIAVLATKGCMLHMDSQSNAGYNYFGGNNEHISLDNAGALSLSKGYNHFGPFYSMNISGTIAGVACPDDCSAPELDATANVWSADGSVAQPDLNFISLYSGSFSMPCSSPPAFFYCPIQLVDNTPVVPATCHQFRDPIELRKPQKSATLAGGSSPQKKGPAGPAGELRNGEDDPGNPMIYTSSFNGVALDDALIFAAEQVETYDSTANDLAALQLFHEILTSSIDRTHPEIRWKMIWGRDQMKGAFEHLVLDGDILPEENAQSFTQPVQQFVDVLNLMTDSVLTDSTYRSQFYLELDKGQFFRTLGRNDIAMQVFTHLGDCQVDSLEQAVLNRWRLQSEMELEIEDQYVDLGLPPNAISPSADASGYVLPVSYLTDEYYFGLHIYSPEELSFVGCNEEFGWKSSEDGDFGLLSVFPNPASDRIQLHSDGPDGAATIQWIDAAGRTVWTSSTQLSPHQPSVLAVPETVRPGMYQLRVHTASGSYPLRLVIH